MCEEEFGKETSRFRAHPCPEARFEASVSESLAAKQKTFKDKLLSRSSALIVKTVPPIRYVEQEARELPELRLTKTETPKSCGVQTVATDESKDRSRLGHKLWFGEHLCKSLGHELERLEVENEEWKNRYKQENKRRLAFKSLESKLMASEVEAQKATMRADELSTLYQYARMTIRSLEERVDALETRCAHQDDTLKEQRERNANQVAALQEDTSAATLERIRTSKICTTLQRRCVELTEATKSLQAELDRVEAKLKRRSLVRDLRKSPVKKASNASHKK